MVSLDMGCVIFMECYFLDGELFEVNFDCVMEVVNILFDLVVDSFFCFDWYNCLGVFGIL